MKTTYSGSDQINLSVESGWSFTWPCLWDMRSGTTATLTIKENQLKKREEIEPTRSTFWPPDGSNNKIITTMVIVRVIIIWFPRSSIGR